MFGYRKMPNYVKCLHLYLDEPGDVLGGLGKTPKIGSSSGKRRDKVYIVGEILEIAKGGSLKTPIMYRANLSFTQLNDYLEFMLKIGLLEKRVIADKDVYRSTGKGLDFLERFGEINDLLKNESDDKNIKSPPSHLLKKNS